MPQRQLIRHALAWAAAAAVLAGVFTLYSHPTLLVTISEMVWACFN